MEGGSTLSIPQPRRDEDLPFYFDYPGSPIIKACLDHFQECHRPEIREMWNDVLERGDGFGKGEDFSYEEDMILGKQNPRYVGRVLLDVTKNKVMGVQYVFPSGMCRSENPLYTGGFLLVNKAYRGRKIGLYLTKTTSPCISKQYEGLLGRIVVTGSNIKPAVVGTGAPFLGIVPWGTKLAGQGWVHDNISFRQFPNQPWRKSGLEIERNYEFPELHPKGTLEKSLPVFKRSSPSSSSKILHHHAFGQLKVTPAETADIWKAQDILRDCAKSGEGFGLDEFTKDGVFSEKLIRSCCYWIISKVSNKSIVAVILAGDSGFCRSPNRKQAAGAIVVLKPYQQKGLANQLLEFCQTQAQALGYDYILTDVLASNSAGLALMRKHRFSITATIPNSCIVRGYGHTDSFLHWKPISANHIHSNL